MKNESKNWTEQAEPILSHLFSGKVLVPVEGGNDLASKILSDLCKINYLLVSKGSAKVYGIHSRVQYGKNDRTFTVPTRGYNQRTEAFASGGMMPDYTMQVYIDDGRIIGLGLVKTFSLIRFIKNGHAEEKASFYVCSWDDLRDTGVDVMEYRAEPEDDEDDEDDEDEELDDMKDIIVGAHEMAEAISDILDKAHITKKTSILHF